MDKPHSTSLNYLTNLFHQPSTIPRNSQPYLLGLRGILVLQSYLCIFLTTFLPGAVRDTANVNAPLYQRILRQTLSILFWNESLIYSSFIFLSGRTISIPFLSSPTKASVASAVFRRGLRLWFPAATALAIVKIITSQIGTDYINDFKRQTANNSINAPYVLSNTLAYFNSVFNLFWTSRKFSEQAGSTTLPSQTLWALNVIYMQSYTVYMTMIIIPYTRHSWRVWGALCFIVTAWWVQSWAWYTITGLLFADAVMNMDFYARCSRGIPIAVTSEKTIRCPVWIPASIFLSAGLVMQYLWTDWRPSLEDSELKAIIIYTVGIKLFLSLTNERHLSNVTATGVCFIVCTIVTALSAEIFQRLVDYPSQLMARWMFDWIRE
ncbi:hypothetical protein P7C71_g947, partial [Lecanoromycetidae sp. Uapishka_2]